MEPRWVKLWYKVPFVFVPSTRVAGCAVQPFSVDLVQIQQEKRLGLRAKSSWTEVLIKGEYAVKSSVAVTACWRHKERIICVKKEEVKKGFILRRVVRDECEEKAKGEEEWSGRKSMRSPCSQRSEMISARFSCGR
jgi:hypothetical protein